MHKCVTLSACLTLCLRQKKKPIKLFQSVWLRVYLVLSGTESTRCPPQVTNTLSGRTAGTLSKHKQEMPTIVEKKKS